MKWKPIKREIIDAATGAIGGRDNLALRINRSKRQIGEYRALERAPVDVALSIESIVTTMAKGIDNNEVTVNELLFPDGYKRKSECDSRKP